MTFILIWKFKILASNQVFSTKYLKKRFVYKWFYNLTCAGSGNKTLTEVCQIFDKNIIMLGNARDNDLNHLNVIKCLWPLWSNFKMLTQNWTLQWYIHKKCPLNKTSYLTPVLDTIIDPCESFKNRAVTIAVGI